jgi:Fe-S cluster assembly ATP-binding protein
MGTNGSGKSTLAHVLAGHPRCRVESGHILFKGRDITGSSADERARMGLFLAFQYPHAVNGLSVGTFLRSAVEAVRGRQLPFRVFKQEVEAVMEELSIPRSFLSRSLNEGFSGGEKKRNEILQLNLLKPSLAVLDETDSGLDVDAVKQVFENIHKNRDGERTFLIITHYSRVFDYIEPDVVHIMSRGRIVRSGGRELSEQIEASGFSELVEEA